MCEAKAFLRAILENPRDETVRFVFADWLDENGEEGWAYLIRQKGRFVIPPGMSAEVCLYPGPVDNHYTVKLAEGLRDVSYIVERGFVDGVILPAGKFTPEVARRLFLQHPVTTVLLRDKSPYWNGGGYCWFFEGRRYPSSLIPTRAELPDFLFGRLDGDYRFSGARMKGYESSAVAVEALSRAAVSWGRELVGLPPLNFPSVTDG